MDHVPANLDIMDQIVNARIAHLLVLMELVAVMDNVIAQVDFQELIVLAKTALSCVRQQDLSDVIAQTVVSAKKAIMGICVNTRIARQLAKMAELVLEMEHASVLADGLLWIVQKCNVPNRVAMESVI